MSKLSYIFYKPQNRSFSYNSRKLLLDRIAFGISRSTLRQQDAKVNIGRLRQRMTALRARAVELVGEAFSGGSEDPTALQLQADELYGMEEVRALVADYPLFSTVALRRIPSNIFIFLI